MNSAEGPALTQESPTLLDILVGELLRLGEFGEVTALPA